MFKGKSMETESTTYVRIRKVTVKQVFGFEDINNPTEQDCQNNCQIFE